MRAACMRASSWVLTICLLAAPPCVRAATFDFPNTPLDYTVVDQNLPDLLREIGTTLGLHVVVSDAVRGAVHGREPRLPARAFLNRLGRIYGFSWYYDGTTLFFFADSEVTSKLVALGAVQPSTLSDALGDLGISDTRWPLHSSPDAGLVVVRGPPRYIELVQQTLAALQSRQKPGVDAATEVHVFHGRSEGPT